MAGCACCTPSPPPACGDCFDGPPPTTLQVTISGGSSCNCTGVETDNIDGTYTLTFNGVSTWTGTFTVGQCPFSIDFICPGTGVASDFVLEVFGEVGGGQSLPCYTAGSADWTTANCSAPLWQSGSIAASTSPNATCVCCFTVPQPALTFEVTS